MADFMLPEDLTFNREAITDAEAFAREHDAASWLFLCGDDSAATGGLSYEQVQAAVPVSESMITPQARNELRDYYGRAAA